MTTYQSNTEEGNPKDDIRPDFLRENSKGKLASNALKAVEVAATLGGAEAGVSAGAGASGGATGMSLGGFKNSVSGGRSAGNSNNGGKKSRLKKVMVAGGASIAIVGILLVVILALAFFAVPIVVLATIDYGLQESLGFSDTSAILEEVSSYVMAEKMANGKVNPDLASDLESYGIEVGQVTLAGDFVRTNNYIADLGDSREVAVNGDYYNNEDGELVIRFNGEVIVARDFVAKLESDPKLYGAFAKGLDISGRFYYSKDVERVYKDLGLSRSNFAKYKKTGSVAKDNEQFEEIFNSVIKDAAKVSMGSYTGCAEGDQDCTEGGNSISRSSEGSGTELVKSVKAEAGDAKSAASLLNTAISATEPYMAAGTFVAVEEALNRARIDGDGPVDPLMATLSSPNPVKVTEVSTGEETVVNRSILRTHNFIAAVNNHSYSVSDAANYSRDRVIGMSGGVDGSIINNTKIASVESKEYNIVVDKGSSEDDWGGVDLAVNSVSSTFYDSPSEITKTVIGGNRVVMGGSFLSNTINARTLGAMPSDAETVAKYKDEVDTVLARQAEAERATLSPFDITSKHTFLGSIVRKLGSLMVTSFSKTESVGEGVISSVAGLFNESVASLTSNTVVAKSKESFLTTNGDCPTASSAANVVGDIYCNTHNTIDTSRKSWGLEDFKRELGEMIGEDGEIVVDKNTPLTEFVVLGMGRETTVGVEDSNICETWKDLSGSLLTRISDALSNLVGLYESCNDIDSDVATGSAYAFSNFNPRANKASLYSSYVLYDKVSAILDDKISNTTAFEASYYARHPKDNSPAGIVARRSGMSKKEAEIALNYANYLDFIAKYRPNERYAFGGESITKPKSYLWGDNVLAENKKLDLIGLITERKLYCNLRTRTMSTA
ncbi:hypothetical protein IJI29_00730 [Candidatus Saccharibacteria bacterium]|nr:hypothetical protein [Candidatus Saccharibacteria bacterium]